MEWHTDSGRAAQLLPARASLSHQRSSREHSRMGTQPSDYSMGATVCLHGAVRGDPQHSLKLHFSAFSSQIFKRFLLCLPSISKTAGL